ncbi:tumor necrosis factor receptor superfamily member 5 [Hippocampus comes]|uniref:CD40 molecule, TNF receptor superfamily member 5 n=1 Tax=Hippocampus comes TaxID=109280 RepID=A0A3Q2XNZ0_HIPCM|nr:PREDICTED: tumor necrosis factor receptor superfamily member 5-like [Hippocampus comes]
MATWMVSTMMTVLWAAAVIISAQPPCDPLTQYELSGQCCQMCPPGTSMSQLGTCKAPHCLQCDQDEYQDTYTTETKCKRQPYCDPNKNFQFAEQTSKTEESICMCKLGFHCSSDVCLTCVPHRPCEPGWGAIIKGNQTHDTVCHKCPEGSFSNQTSWHSDCLTWTKCKSGYVVRQSGSAQSDVVCENQRMHVIIACVFILGMGILLAAAVKIWSSRRRREDIKGKDDEDPPKEALIAFDGVHEEPMSPGVQVSLADSSGTGEPEENEDRPSQVALLSDKGNYVTQENGKAEVLSRQESQSMTGTSEMSC